MIQRIQSLYLLAALVLSIAVMFSDMFYVSDGTDFLILGAMGISQGELVLEVFSMLPVAGLMVLNGLILVFAITQYKKRNVQSNLVKLSVLITILGMGWIAFVYYQIFQLGLDIGPVVGIFHTPLMVFANLMALKGIKKDEALVRSVDRLR